MNIGPRDIMSPAHPKEISKEFKELVSLEHLFFFCNLNYEHTTRKNSLMVRVVE